MTVDASASICSPSGSGGSHRSRRRASTLGQHAVLSPNQPRRDACPTWLAQAYGRPFGQFTTSGSAALELALRSHALAPGARVGVPAATCRKVVRAVIAAGATPVLIDAGVDLLLTPKSVAACGSDLAAVIAVHQFGLPCEVAALRLVMPRSAVLVEDSAMAWRVCTPALSGHMVITSFGPTKPLSLGRGGALLYADNEMNAAFLAPDKATLTGTSHAFTTASDKKRLRAVAAQQDGRLRMLRLQMPLLLERLRELGLSPWQPRVAVAPGCMFVPLRIRDRLQFQRLRHAPEATALGVCAPSVTPLYDQAEFRGRVIVARTGRAHLSRHQSWILIDPVATLQANPAVLARWARRVR